MHVLTSVVPSQFTGNFSDSLIMQLISTPTIKNKQFPNKYENSVDIATICDERSLGISNKCDSAMHFAIQLQCIVLGLLHVLLQAGIYRETESQFDSIDGNYNPGSYKNVAPFARKAMEKTFYHTEFSQPSTAVSSAHQESTKNTLKSIWRNHFFSDNVQTFYSFQIFSNFYLYCFCSASYHTADFFFCLDMFRYCTPLSCDYLFSQDAQHFTFSFYYLLQ